MTLYDLLKNTHNGDEDLYEAFFAENDIELPRSRWQSKFESLSDYLEYQYDASPHTLNGVKVGSVHTWGGEGEGDSIGVVFRHGDDYVGIYGQYDSYNGQDWSYAGIKKVSPVQVERTEYHEI